jgi:hypothetical protein
MFHFRFTIKVVPRGNTDVPLRFTIKDVATSVILIIFFLA